jgi:hypothetical protein
MKYTPDQILKRASSIEIVPWHPRYLDQAVHIGREMHELSLYRDMPFDEAKCFQQLSLASELTADRYFRLAVRNGIVLGGFYGAVSRTFFCDEIIAKDMGWWVTKSARGGLAAILMLRDFEIWARSKGARKIIIGQSTGDHVDMEKLAKLYVHCGYRIIGFNAAKDL